MKTLIIGSAIVDIVMEINKLPERGGDALSTKKEFRVGGCAYNVALISKIFSDNQTLFAPIGDGFFASIIEKDFIKNNFKIVLKYESEDNGYCVVLVEPDGERTFVTHVGVENYFNEKWFKIIDLENYENIYFEGYKIFSQGGATLINELLKLKNKNFYFCPGPLINEIKKEVMKKIMLLNPIIHLNLKELEDYTKENNLELALQKIYLENKNLIILTLGSEGSLYFNGKKIKKFKSNYVSKVKNTIGAGDSHIATLISFLSKKISLDESMVAANLVAGKVVQEGNLKIVDENFLSEMRKKYEK